MSTNSHQYTTHRSTGFVLLGLFLMALFGFMLFAVLQPTESRDIPSAYDYTVKQSITPTVTYVSNSFFETAPSDQKAAYVTDLTDSIKATFDYSYTASAEESLTYTYNIKALVRGTYALKGNTDDMSDVWQKEFELLAPVTKRTASSVFSVRETVTVPFAEYKTLIDQFKSTLAVPIVGEVVISLNVNVSGSPDNTPFNDVKTARLSAPLDSQVYRITTKYDKESKHQVASEASKIQQSWFEKYQLAGTILVGVLGIAALIYGSRRQIFKTAYQRELERIYRYHDGIIIKASQKPDLSHKHAVYLQSFGDMLNLEEELKTPIVASTLSEDTTQFSIIRDDTAYVFQLGKAVREDTSRSLEDIQASLTKTTPTVEKKSTKKRKK